MEIRWQPVLARRSASSSGRRAMRGLVLADHLAQHPGRGQAGRPGQVDGGLGVAGPLQHPARPVAEGEDVPGPVQVGRPGVRVDQGLDGGRPVGGRDAGRGAVAVVHADREGGALGPRCWPSPSAAGRAASTRSGVSGDADQARGVGQEEGDLLGRGGLGRHDQVALVLAVLVVDDDDDLAPCRWPRSPPRLLRTASTRVTVSIDRDAASLDRRGRPPVSGAHGRQLHPQVVPQASHRAHRPRHSSSMVAAPGTGEQGRASSPPKRAGAR